MIHIYTGNDKSSKSAISYFLQGIEVNVCRKSQLTREMIKAFYKTFPFLIDEFFS